jgi:hypothetical protein
MPKYIVMHRTAHMPTSVKARYRRIGVVELAPGFEGEPSMLSPRAKGVVRIVETWERLHAGTYGPKTAFARALVEAEALAAKLNEAGA